MFLLFLLIVGCAHPIPANRNIHTLGELGYSSEPIDPEKLDLYSVCMRERKEMAESCGECILACDEEVSIAESGEKPLESYDACEIEKNKFQELCNRCRKKCNANFVSIPNV